jgi:hypothetical protein
MEPVLVRETQALSKLLNVIIVEVFDRLGEAVKVAFAQSIPASAKFKACSLFSLSLEVELSVVAKIMAPPTNNKTIAITTTTVINARPF